MHALLAQKLEALLTLPPMHDSMTRVIIIYVFMNSMATSIWMFNAWTPFIYHLFGGSNGHVALMYTVNRAFELGAVFIGRYLAESVCGPSRILEHAVNVGFLTLCVVFVGIWTEKTWLLIFAQCCEGTYMGLFFTCVESVFAQGLRRGERDRLYNVRFAFEAAGSIMSLVVSVILYSVVGNVWDVSSLRWVMTAGLGLHLTSMVTFLHTFEPLPWAKRRKLGDVPEFVEVEGCVNKGPCDDILSPRAATVMFDHEAQRLTHEARKECLPSPSFAETASVAKLGMLQVHGSGPSARSSQHELSVHSALDINNDSFVANLSFQEPALAGVRRPLPVISETTLPWRNTPPAPEGDIDVGDVVAPVVRQQADDQRDSKKGPPAGVLAQCMDVDSEGAIGCSEQVLLCIPLEWYPVIVVAADIVLTMGSGMATQYFALFMISIYKVSPVEMSLLGLCNSLLITVMVIVNGLMGKLNSRVRAIFSPRVVGTLILVWMVLARETVYGPKTLMCIAYVLRSMFMNFSNDLSRAMLIDLVPENKRGWWNAMESIQAAGWSGPAVIGGYMTDIWGYSTAFSSRVCSMSVLAPC